MEFAEQGLVPFAEEGACDEERLDRREPPFGVLPRVFRAARVSGDKDVRDFHKFRQGGGNAVQDRRESFPSAVDCRDFVSFRCSGAKTIEWIAVDVKQDIRTKGGQRLLPTIEIAEREIRSVPQRIDRALFFILTAVHE